MKAGKKQDSTKMECFVCGGTHLFWLFPNPVTGLGLQAQHSHVRQVRFLKARAVSELSPGVTLLECWFGQRRKAEPRDGH